MMYPSDNITLPNFDAICPDCGGKLDVPDIALQFQDALIIPSTCDRCRIPISIQVIDVGVLLISVMSQEQHLKVVKILADILRQEGVLR